MINVCSGLMCVDKHRKCDPPSCTCKIVYCATLVKVDHIATVITTLACTCDLYDVGPLCCLRPLSAVPFITVTHALVGPLTRGLAH